MSSYTHASPVASVHGRCRRRRHHVRRVLTRCLVLCLVLCLVFCLVLIQCLVLCRVPVYMTFCPCMYMQTSPGLSFFRIPLLWASGQRKSQRNCFTNPSMTRLYTRVYIHIYIHADTCYMYLYINYIYLYISIFVFTFIFLLLLHLYI